MNNTASTADRFVVGLTGGIGSGKSTVADGFAALGIAVVDADIASRAVVTPGQPALADIASHFGQDILQNDGQLDRAALRAQVFTNTSERKWLQSLLHPLINAWIRDQIRASTTPYTLLVNPLLIESGQVVLVRRVLVVDSAERHQVQRTMARDANSEEQVRAIMSAQASRQQRLAHANDVIENNGSVQELSAHIARLHEQYLKASATALDAST